MTRDQIREAANGYLEVARNATNHASALRRAGDDRRAREVFETALVCRALHVLARRYAARAAK
jgi:triphosphoribosyl-dephospho-CoA synthetase